MNYFSQMTPRVQHGSQPVSIKAKDVSHTQRNLKEHEVLQPAAVASDGAGSEKWPLPVGQELHQCHQLTVTSPCAEQPWAGGSEQRDPGSPVCRLAADSRMLPVAHHHGPVPWGLGSYLESGYLVTWPDCWCTCGRPRRCAQAHWTS